MFLNARPHITVFGVEIYYYAIIIVSGIAVAIALFAHFLKKNGYDPYDAVDYAVIVIPLAILGARLYFFLFPYDGHQSNWGTFWKFRNGGLGIYGAVIVGYITAAIVAKVKKQNFFQISDLIVPGLLIAQCIGRWGNFANQEAYGNMVTNPDLQFFPFAVFIDSKGAWFQATFFYESLCTGIGFVIALLLMRSKKYRVGQLAAFYGIYYGIVRLAIESLRSDSLYLWVGGTNTGIKISQAVAVFTILFGIYRLAYIYRHELFKKYKQFFKNDEKEVKTSLILLYSLIAVSICLAVVFFVIGEPNIVLVGGVLIVASLMMGCGVVINLDRKKMLDKNGSFAQIAKNDDGTIICTGSDGNEWSFKPNEWAKFIFQDRRPPIKTKNNAEQQVLQ